MLMAWTTNTDVPTANATTPSSASGLCRMAVTNAPAAAPAVAAITAGKRSVRRYGPARRAEPRRAASTTNPGRPGLTGPGAGMVDGRFATPRAMARFVRQTYPGVSHPSGTWKWWVG